MHCNSPALPCRRPFLVGVEYNHKSPRDVDANAVNLSSFMHVGIRVKDLQKSLDFYTKLLGMRIKVRSKIERTKGEIARLVSEKGGFILELNYYEKHSPYYTEYVVGEGLDHLTFEVDDLAKTLEQVRTNGYRVIEEKNTDENRWAIIEDPNGIWVGILTPGIL